MTPGLQTPPNPQNLPNWSRWNPLSGFHRDQFGEASGRSEGLDVAAVFAADLEERVGDLAE